MCEILKLIIFTSLFTLNLLNCYANSINLAPYFVPGTGDFSGFSIPENFLVGTSVYKLKGVDPEGKKVSFSISGPYFSVERDSGIVKLIKELDRETQNELEIFITVTDEAEGNEEPNTVSLRRIIPIRDYNDNKPTFLGRPYVAKIVETSRIGYILDVNPIIIIDRDEGINCEITVTCFRGNDMESLADNSCDYFDILTIKNGEGNYSAEIRLIKPVDFETRKSYILTIVAQDGAHENPLTSNATININVIDAQDQPPMFYGEPYSISLKENLEAQQVVLAINASDGDIGHPNDVILTLEKEKFGYFKLLKSGKGQAQLVTTERQIDRENQEILENGGYYSFNVRATEVNKNLSLGDSSVSTVTVMVQDVDDNFPEFNQAFFNLSIPENLENGTALPKLSIIVNDKDSTINSRYNLLISDVMNSDEVFEIFPKTSEGRTQVIVKVKNSNRLDYDVESDEERTFIFEINAMVEDEIVSKALVEVHLEGVNDNFPIFDQSNYRLQVAENSEIGLKIADIAAVDNDVGKFGKLKYLLRGFGAEYFQTNQENGGIFVKNNLDYEMQKSYSLSLIAKDGGGRETNANIFIDILDLNDNFPQFEYNEYYRNVREGSKSFESQFYVKAHDVDGPSQGNGKVFYQIDSENSISGHVFSIDSETGELSISELGVHSSDTFDGNYEMMVRAQDFGHPPLKNYTKVIIRVGSENQRPVFQGHFASSISSPIPGPPTYRLSIAENSPAGSNLTMVQASDPDGNDKLLRYRIMDPSDTFVIDEISGIIKISSYARLDRDAADSYTIAVYAIDGGTPKETSTATVKVTILDINNKSPKFVKQSFTAYVPERNRGTEILTVHAIDTDLDAKLKYSIVEPVVATTKAGLKLNQTSLEYKSIFEIDEDSGSIKLMRNSLENSGLYSVTLTIKVQDLNAINQTQQVDTCEVILYIQSYKETGPIFLNEGWNHIDKKIHLEINEEIEVGKSIITLEAVDTRTEEKIFNFEMDDEASGFFKLLDGKIVVGKRIDYESVDETVFNFDVKAVSFDLFSVAHFTVDIKNINDNSPIFDKDSYKATVLENIKYPHQILIVKAIDKDAVKNEEDQKFGYSDIRYSLSGPHSDLFTISQNGEIQLAKNQSLDREKMPIIKFKVIAEDSLVNPSDSLKKMADVTIDVLDVNDNAPLFLNRQNDGLIYAVVPESSMVDSLIVNLETYDPDEDVAGEVRYEIMSGEIKKLLNLNSKTGELRTAKLLTGRGRSEPYEILVRASDNGGQLPKSQSLFTDQIVQIFIGDTFKNDGTPYFTSANDEEANITENALIGTIVYQLKAKDADDPSTQAGMLRYRIQNDIEDAKFFKIEALSGIITTTQVLDREVKNKYNIIVEVQDQGEPPQAVTRVLKINVLDEDDEEPKFVRELNAKPIEFKVLEEQTSGVILGDVTALDNDIGENGAIDYAIIDGNEQEFFKLVIVNNSALLTTTKSIDREKYEKFLLTIKCFKMSSKWQRPKNSQHFQLYNSDDLSEVQVLIQIIDIDDHLVQFEKANFMIAIRNSIPLNTLIYTIKAFDLDSDSPPINYDILNISYVSQFTRKDNKFKENFTTIFELNNKTGEILLAKSVSDFVDGYFLMIIRGGNMPNRYMDATVKVFIVRDKSLMKFIFSRPPIEMEQLMTDFALKLRNNLNGTGMEFSMFDSQVLSKPDQIYDFSSTSSCFHLFKNGNLLSIHDTKRILNSEEFKNKLRDTYLEYSVDSIDLCSFGKESSAQYKMMSSSGMWLVVLAFVVSIASLISTLAACCLFRRSKSTLRSPILQQQRISSPDIYNTNDGQPVIYTEPIYTIM